jgi:uncharacterized protein YjiS (DUF1127 family)
MNHENRKLSLYGPADCFDALMAPAYALAEGLICGFSAVHRYIARGLESRRRERAIAVTIRELSGLDDRVLRDIGIERGNIHAVSVAVVDDPNVNVREIAGE